MKLYLAIFFVLMCVSQWYIPASMIVEQEDIVHNGKAYQFKTAPVDPNDPFRGKYITLNFEAETYMNTNGPDWDGGEKVFVIVKEDRDGFAAVAEITDVPPEPGTDFFSAEVRYRNQETVMLDFPFDRFYLEESKAPEAEQAYAESNTNDQRDAGTVTYAVVRMKEGKAALVDVRIDDRSIVEIVRERNAVEE